MEPDDLGDALLERCKKAPCCRRMSIQCFLGELQHPRHKGPFHFRRPCAALLPGQAQASIEVTLQHFNMV